MKRIIVYILSLFMVILPPAATALAADNDDTIYDTVCLSMEEFNDYKPVQEKEENGTKYIYSDYEILSLNEVSFTIETPNLESENYNAPSTVTNPDNSSQIGKLSSVSYKEVKTDNRTKVLTEESNFTAVQLDYVYPDTINTTYTDNKTGKNIDAVLKVKDINKSDSYWTSTEGLKGTVTMYNCIEYRLDNSNVAIPKNEEKPTYKGYENQILKSLKLDSSIYKIVGSSWTGDAYYNSDGVLCRDCIYDAQIKVCDTVVTYESEIDLPDITTYTAIAAYIDEADSEVVLKVNYSKEEAGINKKAIVIGAVIGVAVLAALTAVILMFLSKRRKQQDI